METVQINTASKQYPVFIGSGIINRLSAFLDETFPDVTTILIITDETVGKLHLSSVTAALGNQAPIAHIVPSGEKAKTFDVYYQCITFALEQRLDRKSLILSLGGGAVGDLAGFVAATFMRGIPFIQVPTTILAHDSAVGGKVAINHPIGKNMIGSFYQPEAVFYDLNYVDSLPVKEKRSGFAEIIKHALIQDLDFYHWLLENITTLENIPADQLQMALTKGVKIKGSIVSQDETETGIRAFLNFGHTLGHAIEAEMGYGNITHGEAVVIGCVFALCVSKEKLSLSFDDRRLLDWLNKLGYETKVPEHLATEQLLDRMKQDKKSIGQKVRFVLLEQIGRPVLYELTDDYLIEQLTIFRNREVCG